MTSLIDVFARENTEQHFDVECAILDLICELEAKPLSIKRVRTHATALLHTWAKASGADLSELNDRLRSRLHYRRSDPNAESEFGNGSLSMKL